MAGTYKSITLASRPKDEINPTEVFKTVEKQKPTEDSLKDGQVIVEAQYVSLDPAMRGWLNGEFQPSSVEEFSIITIYQIPGLTFHQFKSARSCAVMLLAVLLPVNHLNSL
jgi:NADPH-dependent curcumin reductase CurA